MDRSDQVANDSLTNAHANDHDGTARTGQSGWIRPESIQGAPTDDAAHVPPF